MNLKRKEQIAATFAFAFYEVLAQAAAPNNNDKNQYRFNGWREDFITDIRVKDQLTSHEISSLKKVYQNHNHTVIKWEETLSLLERVKSVTNSSFRNFVIANIPIQIHGKKSSIS
jgi:hypothetical protein